MRNDVLFFLTSCMFGISTLGFLALWLRARQDVEKLRNRLWGLAAGQGLPVGSISEELPMIPPPQPSRVEQLEVQVDAMSRQMDRLAESQEFLSRVLTDRIDQLPDPRMRTPH